MARLEIPVLIARKRDGEEIPADELTGFIAAYTAGDVPDEQMSAFLMAGVIRGFSEDEAVALTEALIRSGDTVDLSHLTGPTVDKHSTGGVGDTTTLIVAPLLAACGVQVAKLSGRGLGHTGGTLDKLESIPGFRVDLSADQMRDQVESIGVAVAAATQDLVPADKRLYALRDVTGTVASPALIASSVMSKKIAGGADHVLLDVKTGDGAFMEEVDAAVDLAELCVRIGEAHGRRTAALVTDMSQPLGDGVGNALEVAGAIEVLRGERPGRLADLSVELAVGVLQLTGASEAEARAKVSDALDGGAALERFGDLVEAQGGDRRVVDAPREVLPSAPVLRDWAPDAGTISAIQCRRIGEIASALGAGRLRKDDVLDPAVGLEVLSRVGDEHDGSNPAVRIHARSEEDAAHAAASLAEAVTVAEGPVERPPLIHRRVGL